MLPTFVIGLREIDPRSHAGVRLDAVTEHIAPIALGTGGQVHDYAAASRSHEIWSTTVPLALLTLALILAGFWFAAGRSAASRPTSRERSAA